MGPLQKDPTCVGEGGGGRGWICTCFTRVSGFGVDLYVFYEGLKLWEAHLYVFVHIGEALGGGTMSNGAKRSCEARWVKWDHMSSSGHHVRCKWKNVQRT